MAFQVVVISPTARQVTIKTKPEIYLADVLNEACSKLRVDPSQYGLKHNNRQLDLSNAIRYCGLSSGARLQLTLLSKSPSIVNVALQLSEPEVKGQPASRLTDKFPSNTTLWFVLRKFESGVAGRAGSAHNLTGRGIPRQGSNSNDLGRLFYETPVIKNQGRTWQSFTDLQKTLAQLGFVNGSVLLRLNFQPTDIPLEEAMAQIEAYFKSAEIKHRPNLSSEFTGRPDSKLAYDLVKTEAAALPSNDSQAWDDTPDAEGLGVLKPSVLTSVILPGVSSRAVTVFSPPISNTPQAAHASYNAKDFVPTVEHARAHQALLSKTGQNQRLLSDVELATRQEHIAEKLAATLKVDIKIRFPDQSSVVTSFSNSETTNDLIQFVQSVLSTPEEPFALRYSGNKGMTTLTSGKQKLIGDLGMINRVLVLVTWEDGASINARRGQSLRTAVAEQGKPIEVQTFVPESANDDSSVNLSIGQAGDEVKSSQKKGAMKNILMHLRKK